MRPKQARALGVCTSADHVRPAE
ncbi:MAG: hypothetical protein V7640_2874, partial [Betaproteobacteria bacterium]